MTNRRRLLLSYLANSFKYLPYSYEYLYYGLVPTTIDSKQVRNKAKVSKLYGNSVVENQLVQNGNFEDTSGWSGYNGTISVSNNILSYSISYLGGDYGSNRVEQQFTNINNHYYLVDVYIKTPYATTVRLYTGEWIILGTTNANQWTRFTQIFEKTGSSVGNNSLYFDVHGQASYQVGDVIQVKQYQKKDITQRHPFDTPTTLTDNRVQAILNGGYIPYNLGELKSVDIGEISSEYSNNNPLSTITFKYQGSGVGTAHDTYELTKTAHVFTKNNRLLDLIQVSGWYYDNTLQWGTNKIENYTADNSTAKEILSEKYTSIRFNGYASSSDNNLISFRDNGYVYVKNGNQTTQPSGLLLYQLATPQVITIPRKHLGIVDLGSLTYTSSSSYGAYSSSLSTLAKKPSNNNTQPNIYCYLYTTSYRSNYSNSNRKLITIDQSGDLDIEDSSLIGLTNAQIQAKLSGILLFYETDSEVSDITDTFDIQSGGTINTNSNVLPNADFLMKCK